MCIINIWYVTAWYSIELLYRCIVFPGSGKCPSSYSFVNERKKARPNFHLFLYSLSKILWDENPEQPGLIIVLTCSEQ